MAIIKYKLIKRPIKINPFLVLGLSKEDANAIQTKKKFREKIVEAINDDELRAKICLAYDIIVNNKFYIDCGDDTYRIDFENSKLKKFIKVYYYCIIGDCHGLIEEIEENEGLLEYKDPLQRNLLYIASRNGHASICEYLINKGMNVNDVQKTGSTALHGAAYYGQIKIVKILLNYGAKTNIKNNFGHLPIDEAMTEEIKTILKESGKDKILELYQSLLSKGIAYKLMPINQYGTIIGKKIICKLINLPKEYESLKIENDWISAWHGTNFTCLESIAEIGLKPAGGKTKGGEEIHVCVSHIGRMKTIDKIKDWANAIFVSPSIFYSAYGAYSKEIAVNNELYKILVECRVKPNSFKEHKSTSPSYVPKKEEPEMLEYRIPPENERDVQVISLTFIKSEFFKNATYYKEGKFLSENNFDKNKINEIRKNNLEKLTKKQLFILKSICKIVSKRFYGGFGFGFLIKLSKNEKPFYCLMTNEHIINYNMINSKETVRIIFDDWERVIVLNKEKRLIQSFSLLDITIVEILKEYDGIDESYFLQPYLENPNDLKYEKTFVQFPNGLSRDFSDSPILKLSKYEIFFYDNKKFSSGCPIFLEDSIKVLGIYTSSVRRTGKSIGNLIFPILNWINGNEIYYKDQYEGEYVNDKFEGKGKYTYITGNYYIGEFKNGKRNGKGEYYDKKGLRYKGDWVDDKEEGEGKYIFENNEYYIGEFKKGKKNGKGKQYNKDGELICEGNWADDKFV